MPAGNILSLEEYSEIVEFIQKYGEVSSIECELELRSKFKEIENRTLSSILFTEWNNRIKSAFHVCSAKAKTLLKKYFAEALLSLSFHVFRRYEDATTAQDFKPEMFLQMAKSMRVPPTTLSRILISEKYKALPKRQIVEMLKRPKLIPDKHLARCLVISIFTDNQDGPIVDIERRCIGEEYEVKLKEMATQAGMVYADERDLRRTGFDKTPDLKLVLPCLYKGALVHWIESKALFGDLKTHRRYIRQQFESYTNRFGPGIVIYWFGFLEDILSLEENGEDLIITNKFPEKEFLTFLQV